MKKIFLYISIGIILLSIPVTVFLVSKNQEIRKRAAPATSLSITPTSTTKKVGETFSLEVKIDTGDNQVMTVQIQLLYDPTKLATEGITNGPLAPSIQVSGKAEASGKASITVGARNNATPIKGVGTIAVVTFRTLTAADDPISIRFASYPDTFANALGEGNNVLVSAGGASVKILNADGTQASDGSSAITLNAQNTATQSGVSDTAVVTLTPTPTTIQESTTSTSASSSALLISSPIINEDVTSTTPQIRGKGTPGTTITVIIHSDPITATVTVDASGNWIYTPTTPLTAGTHTVEAMYTDPTTGETQTKTITFVVPGSQSTTEESTGSAMPVSGNIHTTMLIILLGTLCVVAGIVLPHVYSILL